MFFLCLLWLVCLMFLFRGLGCVFVCWVYAVFVFPLSAPFCSRLNVRVSVLVCSVAVSLVCGWGPFPAIPYFFCHFTLFFYSTVRKEEGQAQSPIGFIASLLSLLVSLPELVRLVNSVSQFHCLNLSLIYQVKTKQECSFTCPFFHSNLGILALLFLLMNQGTTQQEEIH